MLLLLRTTRPHILAFNAKRGEESTQVTLGNTLFRSYLLSLRDILQSIQDAQLNAKPIPPSPPTLRVVCYWRWMNRWWLENENGLAKLLLVDKGMKESYFYEGQSIRCDLTLEKSKWKEGEWGRVESAGFCLSAVTVCLHPPVGWDKPRR